MVPVAKACGIAFGLLQGYSAETSGGLLISIPKDAAPHFVEDIQREEGLPAWIVGEVISGDRTARIVDAPRITEVPAVERERIVVIFPHLASPKLCRHGQIRRWF